MAHVFLQRRGEPLLDNMTSLVEPPVGFSGNSENEEGGICERGLNHIDLPNEQNAAVMARLTNRVCLSGFT